MNIYKANKNRGSSLIEVLIYVAILAIIGTILAGYFVVAVRSEQEHGRRNDLANSVQNITSTLRYDFAKAKAVGEPLLQMSSSSKLEILSATDLSTFEVIDGSLVKTVSTSTVSLTAKTVKVNNIYFMRREHYEQRLNATTTSIEFHVLLEHRNVPNMVRSIDSIFLVGSDIL